MPRSVRIDRPQPTWKQGFARYASVSAHPGLRKGLIHAYSMGLGPTGTSTLRDVGSRKINIPLVGSMTASDWVISDGRYWLDFDGSDDAGTVTVDVDMNGFTVSIWIVYDAAASTSGHVVDFNQGTSRLVARVGSNDWFIRDASSNTIGSVTMFRDDGVINQHAVTILGTTAIGYKNGLQNSTGSNGAYVSPTINNLKIGLNGGNKFAGLLDEILIWDRALTDAEHYEIFRIGRGGIFQLKPTVVAKAPAAPAGGVNPKGVFSNPFAGPFGGAI